MSELFFKVDSRLPELLSQEYSSTERALKELVDNSWDADAEIVRISLPAPMTAEPIIINDDGTGMTLEEIRGHYLLIARDRTRLRGDYTQGKNRRIKGRKGIGKFSGFMAASYMQVETKCRGLCHSFRLILEELVKSDDVELHRIEVTSVPCGPDEHGTVITLSNYHQGYNLPSPEKFKGLLLREYGRVTEFQVYVNDKVLGLDDARGAFQESHEELKELGPVHLRFVVSSEKRKLMEPGIVIKVKGKAVGKPLFFDLDQRDDIPCTLLSKVYGEIDADGLEPHVTAGWDAIVENSQLWEELREYVQPLVVEAIKSQYGVEMNLAHARLQKEFQERQSRLPEYKREFAERAFQKIMKKFYEEPEEKIRPLVFVILEALERNEYRDILEHLASAPRSDIMKLSEALESFGLAEMALLVDQAQSRIQYLDQLEALADNPSTLEIQMHKAIEKSLWIFGQQYSFFSSNQTLSKIVQDYQGKRGSTRPDLLLNQDIHGKRLLIEFKRPSHGLVFHDYTQATTYRHELLKNHSGPIEILIVGGFFSDPPSQSTMEPGARVLTFRDLIAGARNQIQWLVENLKATPVVG